MDLDFCSFDSIACKAKLVTLDYGFDGPVLARHYLDRAAGQWNICRVSFYRNDIV